MGRAFEYAAKENYMKGNISGFLHLDIGQEALSDGATNGRAFFEPLNIAARHKLPLLFLCENNEYAIGTKIT